MAGVARHEDLIAWQRANELELEVFRFTAIPTVARDFSFCRQIRNSSGSVPANIAEGFCRFRPTEFARFLDIARGSLGETQNHLRRASQVGYLDPQEFTRLWLLSHRAMAATTRLRNSLKSSPYRQR